MAFWGFIPGHGQNKRNTLVTARLIHISSSKVYGACFPEGVALYETLNLTIALPRAEFSRQQTVHQTFARTQDLHLYQLATCCGGCNAIILLANSEERAMKAKELSAKFWETQKKLLTDSLLQHPCLLTLCTCGIIMKTTGWLALWTCDALCTRAIVFRMTWEGNQVWWLDKDLKGQN